MANHTQTGSISFEAVGGFSSYASGQFTTTEDVAQMAQPNLTPYFSAAKADVYNATTNPNGYWSRIATNSQFTTYTMEEMHNGSGGWAHFAGNATSNNPFVRFEPVLTALKPSTTYTFLVEWDGTFSNSGNVNLQLFSGKGQSDAVDPFATAKGVLLKGPGAATSPQYVTVSTRADMSEATVLGRSYLQVYGTGAFDCYVRISLYEGEYEGPYKPYVDQSLITRVSTAETAIEQNAENILLRATKTEAYQVAQPNLVPWFSAGVPSLPSTYWKYATGTKPTMTDMGDGWVHMRLDNSAGTGTVRFDYDPVAAEGVECGKDYTLLFELRNISGSSGDARVYAVQAGTYGMQFWGTSAQKLLQGFSRDCNIRLNYTVAQAGTDYGWAELCDDGVYRKRVVKKSEASDSQYWTRSDDKRCVRLVAWCAAGAVYDAELRFSIYEGEYTGPYKPYSGTQLYASQAQLKVANDEIDLRVEKSGVIAAINASTEAEGGSAVKISADKVNVEGAAIFTSGRLSQSSLNDAYDSKGAASAVQTNLDNLAIGGTNLLGSTANPSSKQIVLNTEATSTFGDVSNYNDAVTLYSFEDFDGYSNALKWTTSGTGNRGAGWYTKVGALKAGETYTFSCKVMSSVATTVHTHTAWRNGSATAGYAGWTNAGSVAIPADEWVDYSYSFKPHSSAKLDWEFYVALCFSGNSGGATFRIAHAKLERGNRASDWSPAPEDQTAYVDSSIDGIQVGGRNLLRRTATPFSYAINTTNYGTHHLYSTGSTDTAYDGPTLEELGFGVGDEVTFTFDWKTSQNGSAAIRYGSFRVEYYGVTSSGTNGYITAMAGGVVTMSESNASGRFSRTATLTAATIKTQRMVLRIDNSALVFTVSNAKLEKGNKATDWTPAPEDVTSRTQRIYYRTSSSTAPTSQYMPTAWVTETGDKWAANSTTVANWTAKATKLTNGTTKYPYLFTCEQRQMGDGTLAYTTVLLDETTTVIDGGTIITGSVHANSLDADSVKANIVQTTDLSATKITSGDIATERMSANIVNAVKAKVSDLYALVAKIGGFVIDATSIRTAALTSNADNSIGLSTADFTRTVNGTSRAGLRFAIGDKFGVTGDGTLYANGANITSINAGNISSGSITADRIKANVISAVNNGTGTINADKVNVSAITIGQSQVTNLTTDLGNKANSSDLTAETSKRKATYGTCSTAAGTADKVVTCANFELYAGAAVTVTFSTANTAVVPKLNVNSTGAVAVWYNNAAASNDNPVLWGANATLTFVYDGSHWVLDEKPPTYAVACSTAAATRDKAATVTGALVVNGTTVAVSFSTANTYVAASLGFNLSGTGDDVIRVDGAVTSASHTFTWAANTTLTLVRRGLCWDVTSNDQASKTATTYLTEGTSNGLMVHRSNNATTGVKITDDVDIVRNGSVMTKVDENGMTLYDGNGTADGNVVAKFSEDLVELGKGSEDAIIKLCDGTGQISLNRLTSDTAWLELMSIYWLKLKGVDSSIELGDEFIYEQGGQSYYAGNVHIESRYNQGERVAEIWMNAEGRDGQTSSIDMYADSINLNGTLTLSTPLADSNLPTMGSADTAGTSDATSGATLAVPYITTDAYGRVTAKGTHTHTIGSLAAGAVTSGTFNAARIPNLNASKITAGTLNSARLPTVPVNKGGTGQTGVTTVTNVASFIAAASGVTVSSVRVTVWGKLVHAYVTAKPDAAKTSAWVVGTVVDAYRPNAVVTGKPYYTGVDSARIQTNGQMQITACGAVEVGVSFTYLLA